MVFGAGVSVESIFTQVRQGVLSQTTQDLLYRGLAQGAMPQRLSYRSDGERTFS